MGAKFQTFTAANGQYYFRLKSANGEIILASEGYTSMQNCKKGIDSVKANAPFDNRYKRLVSRLNEPYFTLHAANDEVIGTSEMYSSDVARNNGIEAVKRDAPDAPVE